jgi:hypothetical protein
MSWADIELKWAAMTSRIGADRTRLDDENAIIRVPPPQPPEPTEACETCNPPPFDRTAA